MINRTSGAFLQGRVSRVLLVDDHPIICRALEAVISREPDLEVCGEARSLAAAMEQFHRTQPDLAIVDVTLTDGSGLELCKEMVAANPDVRVLIYSMHEDTLYAERALRAGAKGYVNKQSSVDHILAAMRRVLEGRVYLSERMTDRVLARTIGSDCEDIEKSPIETLSDRELEVFEQIGHGVPTRQIAARLRLSTKTVETYRENIKHKLSLCNATELTQHAVQWVLECR